MDAFPITWEDGEEGRFWFWDQSHWPHPTTPLSATFELPAMAEGFTRACRALRRPFPAYHVKVVNGFVYFGFDLVTSAADRAAAAADHATALAPRIPDVLRFWTEEALPEVRAINDRMRFTDWDALSDAAFAAALDELYTLRVRQWELHDLVLVPAMAALAAYLDLYARRFPGAPPDEAHRLLRGLPNKTTEAAIALWRLAREAGPHPQPLSQLWERGEPGSADLPLSKAWEREGPGLARLPLSQAWERGSGGEGLRAYLDAYGWRTDGWELADPSLRERPEPLLARLTRYAEGNHPDPERELARAAEERERLTAEALARLPDAAARAEFEAALAAARAYPVLSEDHNFAIDQMGLTALRVPFLALGRRLAERGVIEQPDDMFYLSREELDLPPQPPSLTGKGRMSEGNISGAAGSPLPMLGEGSGVRAASVAARRAERARWWDGRPPAAIGTPLPDELKDDPLYAGFFGIGAEPPAGERVLRGTAGAPGVAVGPARVVRTLADADRLAPGDILICPMTSPAWTPLFATVAAVVADAGGALSHTAIVAREMGIPCVVATRIACREIADGDWVEVDGTAGEVRRIG